MGIAFMPVLLEDMCTNKISPRLREVTLSKVNTVVRLAYSGGLLGLIFGSSKGQLNEKSEEMNQRGWNIHFVHSG